MVAYRYVTVNSGGYSDPDSGIVIDVDVLVQIPYTSSHTISEESIERIVESTIDRLFDEMEEE